jgi:hypothetical protein
MTATLTRATRPVAATQRTAAPAGAAEEIGATLQTAAAPAHTPAAPSTADRARVRQTLSRAGDVGVPLKVAGWQAVPDAPQLVRTPTRDWLVLAPHHDRLVAGRGGLAVPESARRRLRQLDRADLDLDGLRLAHELAYRAPDPLPTPAVAPLRAGEADALLPPAPPAPQTVRLADRLERLARSAVGGMRRSRQVLSRPAAGVDPVVFGIVRSQHIPDWGAWIPLAWWAW